MICFIMKCTRWTRTYSFDAPNHTGTLALSAVIHFFWLVQLFWTVLLLLHCQSNYIEIVARSWICNEPNELVNATAQKFIPIVSSWIKWLIVIIACMIVTDFASQLLRNGWSKIKRTLSLPNRVNMEMKFHAKSKFGWITNWFSCWIVVQHFNLRWTILQSALIAFDSYFQRTFNGKSIQCFQLQFRTGI